MDKENVKLNDLIPSHDRPGIINEIKHIVSLIVTDFDFTFLEQVHADMGLLFSGEFPGYRASNTKYHDQEHTCLVALALTRLIHGLFVQGHEFSRKNIQLGILAALFHDTGLIQTEDDREGSGAKYTVGHEERSIAFMKKYLSAKNFSTGDLEECASIIKCTILEMPTKEILFQSKQTEIIGKILGTADLLAQMADRYYLEKLPLLFKEFQEGGINGYDSELELLKKTEEFYRLVAQARLTEELDNIAPAMQSHFKARWDLDRDLYAESIAANIVYLSEVHQKCRDIYECYVQYLRRGNIMDKFYDKKQIFPDK